MNKFERSASRAADVSLSAHSKSLTLKVLSVTPELLTPELLKAKKYEMMIHTRKGEVHTMGFLLFGKAFIEFVSLQ